LPAAAGLAADPRVQLLEGDFFDLVRTGTGFDPLAPGRRFSAILLDIDHTPRHLLHPSHADLYSAEGLHRLASLLRPGGVFALWSDDPPDDAFGTVLAEVFAETSAHVVEFDNPLTGGTSSNTGLRRPLSPVLVDRPGLDEDARRGHWSTRDRGEPSGEFEQ
jgi:spermidine synthase